MATRKAERVYIAGDDKQAIFNWSGADVDTFLNLKGKQVVLEKSYRLPSVIHEYANKISDSITHKYPVQFSPHCEGGSVDFVNDIADIEIREGSNLLLARNKYLLKKYEEFLRSEGYPYVTVSGSSIDPVSVTAIKAWEALRAGRAVDVSHVRSAYSFLKVGAGVARGKKSLHGATGALTMSELQQNWGLLTDTIWHDAFVEMVDAEYYLAALRRGEKLDAEPRIHISTIHTVKGGEADHVVVLSDVSWKTYAHVEEDDEKRVAYVAVTRAKKTLQIVLPQTKAHFRFP